jgi:hypothetical protein
MSARQIQGVDPFKGYRETVAAPVERWETFRDMQTGPNPLSVADLEKLAARHPTRWAAFLAIAKKEGSS